VQSLLVNIVDMNTAKICKRLAHKSNTYDERRWMAISLLNSSARMGTSGGEFEGTDTYKANMAYTKKIKKIIDDGIITYINDYGIDPEHREIYLFPREEYMYGGGDEGLAEPGVEFSLANQFIRNIRILSNISKILWWRMARRSCDVSSNQSLQMPRNNPKLCKRT